MTSCVLLCLQCCACCAADCVKHWHGFADELLKEVSSKVLGQLVFWGGRGPLILMEGLVGAGSICCCSGPLTSWLDWACERAGDRHNSQCSLPLIPLHRSWVATIAYVACLTQTLAPS